MSYRRVSSAGISVLVGGAINRRHVSQSRRLLAVTREYTPVSPVFRRSRVHCRCRDACHYVESGAYVSEKANVNAKEVEEGGGDGISCVQSIFRDVPMRWYY